ncbi:MAG: hypothetical protein K2X93_17270 [Candidatus Obscuribacterales bacterium]|nr:hypothetical protein [Candidatus Obscuribacterales bacterium]
MADIKKLPSELDALSLPIQPTDILIAERAGEVQQFPASSLVTELRGTAGETISAHKVLVLVDGELFHADPTDIAHIGLIVGVSVSAANIGEEVRYLQAGELTGGSFAEGERYYVGLAGALSTTPLAVGAVWRKFIGVSKSTTVLVMSPGPTFKTA